MREYYFQYGQEELDFLKSKDKKLGAAIDQIGMIHREVMPDLFPALVHAIIGQQISTKAQITLWKRLQHLVANITPHNLASVDREALQAIGLSYKKTDYIQNIARLVASGRLDLEALQCLPDQQVIHELSALPGIGEWTAEMLLLFSMRRPDILSYKDLAIIRGMRMLYRHRKITPELFNKYRRRYSPHASVASLYLWKIAAGALPDLTDPFTG